jgi:hypothetical protein
MGKNTEPEKKGRPKTEASEPPTPGFLRSFPKAEEEPRPQPAAVLSGGDLLKTLKDHGREWEESLERILEIPSTLMKRKTDSGTFYSESGKFEIDTILSGLPFKRIPDGLTDYGAAFYSTGGGSVYVVFADMKRKIIVKERIFCISDDPPEKKWGEFGRKLEAALSYSQSEGVRSKGKIVIYDQDLDAVDPV